MFRYFIASLVLTFSLAQGAAIPSTVEGISIGNAHALETDDDGVATLVRSRRPTRAAHYREIAAYGLTDVLIFKRDTDGSVEKERKRLAELGLRVERIAFKWKDLAAYPTVCRQVMKGLRWIKKVEMKGGRGLFHCTAGEDRTGLLAGTYRLLTQARTARDVFENEMCRYGYAGGDPGKLAHVVAAVDAELTPLYLKLAYRIAEGKLDWETLDDAHCGRDPGRLKAFRGDPNYDARNYRCEPSALAGR